MRVWALRWRWHLTQAHCVGAQGTKSELSDIALMCAIEWRHRAEQASPALNKEAA